MVKTRGGSFVVFLLWGLAAVKAAEHQKANIILFLVDDMGWVDCGAYGSRYYETPNIDRFARQGMQFTAAYSAHPLCSPTRAIGGWVAKGCQVTVADGALHITGTGKRGGVRFATAARGGLRTNRAKLAPSPFSPACMAR